MSNSKACSHNFLRPDFKGIEDFWILNEEKNIMSDDHNFFDFDIRYNILIQNLFLFLVRQIS